jgi:murein DD-endopeptidase MepM/ murein hydrolase activator NlpD
LATITDTYNINLGIDIAPKNLNDYNNGLYRIDLKYKTLTSAKNEADVTVPVKLASQATCNAGDAQCAISNISLPGVYTDKLNSTDSRYYLNVSLNSDIKNDLNCWNSTQNISVDTVPVKPVEMQLDLQAMKCNYSFKDNSVGGSCNISDIANIGIVAPWQNASGTRVSNTFGSGHPGIDVTASEGSPIVSAGDGVVVYVRKGDVKDDIYFNQEAGGIKCEEGSRSTPDSWVCVCDWCPLQKVTNGTNSRPDLCNAQRDCLARANALQSSSSEWVGDGALNRIYGNIVIIEHANHKTIYAHMNSISVNVGDCVTAGQSIGIMGSTGSSSGRHVHFEIRTNSDGFSLNPGDFKCVGTSCGGLNALSPLNENLGLPNYLGVTTEENNDFAEGPINLTDANTNPLSRGIYKLETPVSTSRNLIVKDALSTPRFYVDKNKNNKFDTGEQELGSSIVGAKFTQIAALQDVSLNQVWSLVSFNSTSNTTVTTRDIADQATLSGLNVQMASYDTDLWTISALKKEGIVNAFYGNQYNLVPGKAFFLKTDVDGIYYNSGQLFSNINKELNVDIGWNFFSFSKDVIDSATLTSYKILDKCKEAGIVCKIFSDYNGQLDNTILVKDIYYGKDYPLIPNKGYILKVESAGTIKI